MQTSFPFRLNLFRILIFLTLGLLAPVLSAQQPFLWKAEREGKESHIMGTIHSSHPNVRGIPDAVIEALAQSSVFMPEIDLTNENIGIMAAAAFDFGGQGWENRVPEHLHSRVRSAAQRAGLPDLMLRNLAFEMIPVFFALPPNEDFFQVMDVRLYQEARDRQIEVRALETVEEQMAVFKNLDDDTIVQLIEEALDEMENGYPQYHELIAAYASGDTTKVERLIDGLRTDSNDDYVEALLDQRNLTMTEKALPALEEGNAFIAVGLAHLLGPGNMLELLNSQGYTIIRIGD